LEIKKYGTKNNYEKILDGEENIHSPMGVNGNKTAKAPT